MDAINYSYIFSLTIITLLIFDINAAPPQKIAGGEKTNKNEFSYLVSLRGIKDNIHFCRGAILDSRHILTSALCAEIKEISDIQVIIGSNRTLHGEISHKVKYSFRPLKYQGPDHDPYLLYDIAILVLEEPLNPNDTYWEPIKLASKKYPVDSSAIIAGSSHKNNTGNFVKLHTKATSIQICEDYEAFIVEHYHMCILPENAVGVCEGDYGGPLVVNNEIVGVVSHIEECGESPILLSDVVEYRKVIDHLLACTEKPEECEQLFYPEDENLLNEEEDVLNEEQDLPTEEEDSEL